MKTVKKVLSILIVAVMLFSVAMPSFAAVKPGTTSADALVKTDSLSYLVEWLLTNLNARKEKIVPTILTFVERYVEDIAAFIPAGKTVDNLNDEQKAEVLLNYLENKLAGLQVDLTDINNITKLIGITLDLTSIDGVLATLGSVTKSLLISKTTAGDANDIKASMFVHNSTLFSTTYVNRTNTSDLDIVYKFFEFLSNSSNIGVIKKALSGTLDLGAVEEFWNPDEEASFLKDPDENDVPGGLNGSMKYIPTYIKNMLYDGLIDKPEMIAKVGRDWSVDEILGYAFLNLLTGKFDITKDESKEVMTSSVYQNILKYAPVLYANMAIEPLNTGFKDAVKNLGDYNAEFKAIITTEDYTFTVEDFNNLGLTVETGILGGLNNMVYVVLDKILTDEAFNALGIEKGTTAEKLNSNLIKICRYVLPMLGVINGEFDFTEFTAEKVANMSLAEIAVEVLKIFYPGWFHVKNNADMLAFIDSIDSMPELIATAVYLGFQNDYYDSRAGYTALLMTDDKKAVNPLLTDEGCIDLAMNILMDKAVYELDYAKADTLFVLSKDNVKAYKEAGWNWKDFAEEIVDWALNMVKGVPAVADNLSYEKGVKDGYGAFNKLNAVVNELIDFSFMNNVSSVTSNGNVISKIDFEMFIFDGVIGNICDFDIAGVLGLFAVNKESGNILNVPFNKSAVNIVDKVLNALFTHTCNNKTDNLINATCTEKGSSVSYCANNGHITNMKDIPAKGHAMTEYPYIAGSCTADGNNQYWSCSTCNKYFSDAKGTTETELSAVTIPQHAHTPIEIPASAETCLADGNNQYWKCEECGKGFSDSAAATEIDISTTVIAKHSHTMTAHAAVAATCLADGNVAYWTCSECAKNYDDEVGTNALDSVVTSMLAHDMTEHAALAETCTSDGNIQYWSCSTCNKYYSDADGATEIEQAATVIAKHAHTPKETPALAETCLADGNKQYWTCEECGKYFSDKDATTEIDISATVVAKHAHTMTEHAAVAATCLADGNVAYLSCSECAKNYDDEVGTNVIDTVTIAKLPHTMTEHAALAETCTADGNIQYWSCSTCNKYYGDANGAAEIEQAATVIAKHPHTMTETAAINETCTSDGNIQYWTCSECKKYYGDSAGTTAIEQSATVIVKHAHTMTEHAAVAATCATPGNPAYWSCSECKLNYDSKNGDKVLTDVVIPIDSNNHNLVNHAAKTAVCGKKGWNAYVDCTRCDYTTYVEIPALKHVSGPWVETKAATTTENGVQIRKCTVCGAIIQSKYTPKIEKKTVSNVSVDKANKDVVINTTDKTISGISDKTTVQNILVVFENPATIEIHNPDGEVVKVDDKDAVIGTGYVVVRLDSDGKAVDTVTVTIKGDVDADGYVASSDARLVLRQSVGLENFTGAFLAACDVDGTEGISSSDARLVLRYAVGLETKF